MRPASRVCAPEPAGFPLKDSGPERLLAAVAVVEGGDSPFAPSVTRRHRSAHAFPPRDLAYDSGLVTPGG
jgi:DNA-binding NarL/FixJ family response regulator